MIYRSRKLRDKKGKRNKEGKAQERWEEADDIYCLELDYAWDE